MKPETMLFFLTGLGIVALAALTAARAKGATVSRTDVVGQQVPNTYAAELAALSRRLYGADANAYNQAGY